MTQTTKITSILILIASLFAIFSFATFAYANPSQFTSGAKTSSATSSPVYMTPGKATSTIVYDSYQVSGTNQLNNGNNYATDIATLLLQFAASGTLSVLNISLEYSDDGIDWYADSLMPQGTTTQTAASISTAYTYTWTFASSTVNGTNISSSSGATSTRAVTIKTPTRFTRAVLSITGAAGNIWGQFVPIKEAK